MDQPAKTVTSEGTDTQNWVGRIIVAVILGEAIWSLIVSVMNNLVVPWLGDVMGQSSGLPTSFTQRPYNYPDLFVSVVEACLAGVVAAILNHFFQRPGAGRSRPAKSLTSTAIAEPQRIVPQTPAVSRPVAPQAVGPQAVVSSPPTPAAAAPPPAKADLGAPSALASMPATVEKPVPSVAPAPAAAESVAKPTSIAAKPQPQKAEPAKPKKPKAVFYNIVGEPVASDED
jgi:hypothetical protein